jgi:hypothetical protein
MCHQNYRIKQIYESRPKYCFDRERGGLYPRISLTNGRAGLDHRLVQLLADPASSGLPALILSGQDGLTTHLAADVGEGMIEAAEPTQGRISRT